MHVFTTRLLNLKLRAATLLGTISNFMSASVLFHSKWNTIAHIDMFSVNHNNDFLKSHFLWTPNNEIGPEVAYSQVNQWQSWVKSLLGSTLPPSLSPRRHINFDFNGCSQRGKIRVIPPPSPIITPKWLRRPVCFNLIRAPQPSINSALREVHRIKRGQ